MGNQFELRQYCDSDVAEINSIRNDKHTLHLMNAVFTKEEDLLQTTLWLQAQAKLGGFYIISLCGRCAGFVKIRPFSFGDLGVKFKELGISVIGNYRGQGLGARAIKAAIAIEGNGAYLARIIADNDASLAVFKKVGFREIGLINRVVQDTKGISDKNLIFLRFDT